MGSSDASGCSSPAWAQSTKLEDAASQPAPHTNQSTPRSSCSQRVMRAVTARHTMPSAVPSTWQTWKTSQPSASNGATTNTQRKLVKPSTCSPRLNTRPLPVTRLCA